MIQIQRPINLKTRCASKLSAKLQHWVLITALAPALTSCMGVYEGGFECPPGEGIKCKSISEVNKMVDQCSTSLPQCSVPSTQNPKCGIPELRDQGSIGDQGSIETAPAIQSSEIWYSPFFENDQEDSRKRKVLNDAISI